MSAPEPELIRRLVRVALAEDHAPDDVTTAALVPAEQLGHAVVVANAKGVIAGLAVAQTAFAELDKNLHWKALKADGDKVRPGRRLAEVSGSLASILSAERIALNFLTHLSGVATTTYEAVRLIDGTGCKLRDTRKTIPTLRALEKYAARVGGAVNHRMDLAHGILVKDNHIAALRARGLGITDAVRLVRARSPMRIEIEVTDVEEAGEAMEAGAHELLLDNMSPGEMRRVVALAAVREPRPVLEASGGITLANAREVAATGVDYISMGAITHSAPALDLSLEVEVG